MATAKEKVKIAAEHSPDILCDKADIEKTLGSDAHYLNDVWDITKSDLIRLERMGLALKARYATENKRKPHVTGPHRTRWLIFKGAAE